MIYDGDERFPNSIVKYTRLRPFALRELFAYLREKEEILQLDLARGSAALAEAKIVAVRLYEVQNQLIWLVANVTEDDGGPLQMRFSFRGGLPVVPQINLNSLPAGGGKGR